MSRLRSILQPVTYGWAADTGLLILRTGIAFMMITHGWSKFNTFGEKAGDFYDFMGLGSQATLILTVFAELFCSLFLMVGFGTRVFLIPLIILAIVIAFVVHSADPFGDKEHGLLFLVPYITLILTGPGKFSLDYWLLKSSKRQKGIKR